MSTSVQVYGFVLLGFILSVLVLGRLLHVDCRTSKLAAVVTLHVGQVAVLALWGARFDTQWLRPEIVFSSLTALVVPAALLFMLLLWAVCRMALWKAFVLAAISHIAAVAVSDLVILGF